MERAAILIGVKRSHRLPALQAVWDGVRQMEIWVRSQGFRDDRIVTITDESKPVDTQMIKRAIRSFVDAHTVEQLFVYFAGHGINNARSEYWLLSDAIVDPSEAVNVTGSEDLARFCGIPHVVFFSDACRTAAVGIQAQATSGTVVFPNLDTHGPEKQVDLFFATGLGHPALEIQDVADTTRAYRAVYTDTLIEALSGKHPKLIEKDAALGVEVIRSWPLKEFLAEQVPVRVFRATQRGQRPDARITSPPDAWLSCLASAARGNDSERDRVSGPEADNAPKTLRGLGPDCDPGELEGTGYSEGLPSGDEGPAPPDRGGPEPPPRTLSAKPRVPQSSRASVTLQSMSKLALRATLDNKPAIRASNILEAMAETEVEAVRYFEDTATLASSDFEVGPIDTGSSFKVRGASVRTAFAAKAQVEILGAERNIVQVESNTAAPLTVVLELDDGHGMAIPALGDFVGAITFDRGELIHVSFDPVKSSWRWPEFQSRRRDLQRLRGIVAASARMGTFRLESEAAAEDVARQMQLAKAYDPSLALYATYAYRDQGLRGRLERMERYQRDDLGVSFFDLALLARRLDGSTLGTDPTVLPALPLLTQGWPLLAAHAVNMPAELEGIRRHVVSESLWTLYDSAGLDQIRHALQKRVIT